MNELEILENEQIDQTISMVERLTLNPNVDTEKLQAIINMQYAEQDRQAKKEFIGAMVKVQSNLRAVTKNDVNPHTNSNFANLEALKKAVVPAYTAEGFMLTFGEGKCELDNYIRVTASLMHEGGHVEEYFYDCPMDDSGITGKVNKTQTHGKASAVSYGERYILKLIFNMTIQDEDNDGNTATNNYRYIGEYKTEIANATVFIDRHVDGLGNLSNSQSFEQIFELLPNEVREQHHYNLPSGTKSAIKRSLKEMSLEVRTFARETLDEIIPKIDSQDDEGTIELLDDLVTQGEKTIVWIGLNNEQQRYINDLKKQKYL